VTVQALDGRIVLRVRDHAIELGPGEVVAMEPGLLGTSGVDK
jgi:quercetin dioxygenase-like cupin family protein